MCRRDVLLIIVVALFALVSTSQGKQMLISVSMDTTERDGAALDGPIDGDGGSDVGTTWNQILRGPGRSWDIDGTALKDSTGAATTVNFSVSKNGSTLGCWAWGSPDLVILTSAITGWDPDADPYDLVFSGLTAGTRYDLYIASFHPNENGGRALFSTTNTTTTESPQIVDNGGGGGNDSTWAKGENYTLFEKLEPDGNGEITIQVYSDWTTDNTKRAYVSGFQLTMSSTPTLAGFPDPQDEATDVPRDVVLNWTPGLFAPAVNGHIVYFGESLDDVGNGVGGVAQSAASYTPPQRLDFGKTYYWRVDEVNAPPDSTVHEGSVWSFTVEPVGYPIAGENITAEASSSNNASQGPENTINGLGLDENDLHSDEDNDMWRSSLGAPEPTWIQYEFDRVYKLHEMWVWNHNTSLEPAVGFGIKEAVIEYSTDGTNWTTLGTTHELNQAPGAPGYAHNTTVDLNGVSAKYVKITANSNWNPGGWITQYGLSEVRFFYIPVWARTPSPASDAQDVGVDSMLAWRAGREADRHDVYFSADEQSVIDGTADVVTVAEPGHAPSLELASTYYWRIDEANDAETPTIWQGDIWNFTTQESIVVDDFESYNDIEAGQDGSNLVYNTWVDGFEIPTNGSTMGYTEMYQPTMESSVVHGGQQSAPLFYDNTAAPLSEITANIADLQAGPDWTRYGIGTLTVWFHGDPNNNAQQMYIKINNTKIPHNDPESLKRALWQMWPIDLSSYNVSNVSTLIIGLDRLNGVGGKGFVFIDDIELRGAPPEIEDISLIENFDALDAGASMHDVEGWEGWYGDAQAGARVTSSVAYSGTNALEIVGGRDDLVPNWPQQTSGQWTLKVMQYCPSSAAAAGKMYFGALSRYDSAAQQVGWVGSLIADFATGKAYCEEDQAIQVDLVYDTWVELRVEIDLYSQVANFYYNNVHLATRSAESIAGVDVWPEAAITGVYFDDFSFTPAQ